MTNLLIVDVETTGLDCKRDSIIEIGGVLWNVENACGIATHAELIRSNENPAESINRIPAKATVEGVAISDALMRMGEMLFRADYIAAHNAKFDRSFIEAALIHCPYLSEMWNRPWICTLENVRLPRKSSSRSLLALALAHDVGVVVAHRALADCETLARLFERCAELGHDVKAMIEQAVLPRQTYMAEVSYADRALAKDAGFTWNDGTSREAPKGWSKRMTEEEATRMTFPVSVYTR